MQLSGLVVALEDGLKGLIASQGGATNFTKPQYSIVRIGMGDYDITLSLSGFGVQHFRVTMIGDTFSISGKMVAIGENPAFPITLIQSFVNNALQKWMKDAMDSLATDPSNSILIAPSPIASAAVVVPVKAAAPKPMKSVTIVRK